MYDGIAILKSYSNEGFDKYGNKTTKEVKRTVFVQPRGVYASEFYNAAQLGLQPSLTLYMTNRNDYQGEKILEFDGKEYSGRDPDPADADDSAAAYCG